MDRWIDGWMGLFQFQPPPFEDVQYIWRMMGRVEALFGERFECNQPLDFGGGQQHS